MCGIGLVATALSPSCTECNDYPACSSKPSSSYASLDSDDTSHVSNTRPSSKFDLELQRRLCQRGPDHFNQVTRRVTSASDAEGAPTGFAVALHSAVLHLRGDKPTHQPVVDSSDNVLCWNGEVFGIKGDSEEKKMKMMQRSDTILLSEKLQMAGEKLSKITMEAADPVVDVLRSIQGPFAVTWLHETAKRVYFAHDRFGRRSLLYRIWGPGDGDMIASLAGTDMTSIEFATNELARFVLSNVAIEENEGGLDKYQELPASGIYVLDLQARQSKVTGNRSFRMEFHPYSPLVPTQAEVKLKTSDNVVDRFNIRLPCPTMALETITDQETLLTLEASARALMVALSNAVGVRVRSIPSRSSMDAASPPARVAVLLSGGLDSVVLAALSHFHAPKNEPVDLLTVCFDENSRFASPDRRAAELAHAELCGLFPERQWNFVKINVTRAELSSVQQEVLTLMAPCDTHMDFNIGAAFWFLSRGRGELENCTQNSDKATLEELNAFLNPQRADLRELATEVAALALFDQIVDDILCPVHKCGRKRKNGCVLGVCKSCCFKIQRVVGRLTPRATNEYVGEREAQGCRAKLVSMGFQSDAHIDLLLMLLKSKREGEQEPRALCCRVHRIKQDPVPPSSQSAPTASVKDKSTSVNEYQTDARVVLVGIGADEQLAGYGRHRTTLINGGEAALRTELEMDLGRIWKRNLGRDDRCIAAHGREARFPYLDEDVVSTIATFPVSSLCDAELPRGVGDKRALRMVAKSLGLRSCAGLAKRAIQFGSRIAKVSNNGSNRQTQGMNKFSSVN
ncbi:Asparagine synthase [Phytophthora infestans]|uniref:Asparagine synthase n=1 Tax=Phytophthora infestans TaxID=4787 RepID=A0A833S8L0_PHYIN|nr:Asparagine synthase [Phytophthora infestans]